ncbi:hypothetical protein ACIPW5_29505 [Streptomyces sp. NPDC090077]|uniref:hypothetical protein n=1 Tax=Streptomyces sp. NPDC090077 TaxID=3365938 RepID=UPI0038045C5A
MEATLHGLLVVDWVPPHGPWDDQIAFIFDAGTLDDTQTAALRPHDADLADLAFLPLDKAHTLLRGRIRNRLNAGARPIRSGPSSLWIRCVTASRSPFFVRLLSRRLSVIAVCSPDVSDPAHILWGFQEFTHG